MYALFMQSMKVGEIKCFINCTKVADNSVW